MSSTESPLFKGIDPKRSTAPFTLQAFCARNLRTCFPERERELLKNLARLSLFSICHFMERSLFEKIDQKAKTKTGPFRWMIVFGLLPISSPSNVNMSPRDLLHKFM